MINAQTVIELSYMEALFDDYIEEHKNISLARKYHNGQQTVYLTERVAEFLGLNLINKFRLNVCRTVSTTVKDELNLIGFDTNEPAMTNGTKKQAAWAWELWQANRMDAIQSQVHESALSDREAFVIVDWDDDNKRPQFTFNQVFTDVNADGDGMGCWMLYENNDPYQKAWAAVKQWTETILRNNLPFSRMRRTIYYPDRIEKWVYDAGWSHYEEIQDVLSTDADVNASLEEKSVPWPIPWVDKNGRPLGIPVIHFKNENMTPEAWDAIPMQDAINKTLVDMLGSADLSAFPFLTAFGFIPTTDGKELKADKSNQMKLSPMAILGSSKAPSEASLNKISGEDPTPLMEILKDLCVLTAIITDTPTSRFVITGQVASEGSQKEQNKPLKKKVRNRQILFGDAWEDCMSMARKLANLLGAAGLDESVRFSSIWEQTSDLGELQQKRMALQIPLEQLWIEAGYTATEIQNMKNTDEYKARLALMQSGLGNTATGG
jgi:hypothetical protein